MKKLIILVFCCFAMSTFGFAQNEMTSKDDVSDAEIERYIDAKLEIEYRKKTYEALNLTSDEIIAFDPVFNRYMDDKEELTQKKMRLLEDFRNEMKEEDSMEEKDEERADFIEDYWEVKIAESELRKDYFDILEDKIPTKKAAQFFIWEEMVEGQMQKDIMVEVMPVIVSIDKTPMRHKKMKMKKSMDDGSTDASYRHMKKKKKGWSKSDKVMKKSCNCDVCMSAKKEIDTYSNWVASSDNAVDMSHEYTANGLMQIVKTFAALDESHMYHIPNLKDHKARVLEIANYIKKDPLSIDHADKIEEAFKTVATLMNEMTKKDAKAVSQDNNLMSLAEKMNPLRKTTNQSAHIHDFFKAVNSQFQQLHINKHMKSTYESNSM